MSGVTKHIFEAELRDIQEEWNKELRALKSVLPKDYDGDTLVLLLKKYYPHEWEGVEYKYRYYKKKDEFLERRKGKRRYNMPSVTALLRKNCEYKKLIRQPEREYHFRTFDYNVYEKNVEKLQCKRKPKIEKIDKKITSAKLKTQQVIPSFIDAMIGLYERKNTNQKDRMYILKELIKYYNKKVIIFLFKLNDTELNKQLRTIAHHHLQSFNYAPRLRRQKYMQVHTNNKKRKLYLKKIYPYETYTIPQNPQELEYRIQNGKEQKLKRYDYFISHSSMDSKVVQKLINYENSIGKNVFCDWVADADYLKRSLLCDATLRVIEWRLKQSDAVIYVNSYRSSKSEWCNYELNYFFRMGRPIYIIEADKISQGDFEYKVIDKDIFYKDDYAIDIG